MDFQQFVGGTYPDFSVNVDLEKSMNLFVEVDESGAGKSKAALLGTPGLLIFGTLATTPVRGLWASGAGRLFAVGGSKLYEVFSDGTSTVLGDVGDDSTHTPVQIFPNGNELFIVSAGQTYLANGVTVTAIVFTPGAAGVVNTVGTAVTWVSGDTFDATYIAQPFTIGGLIYTISAVADSTHLTLTATAGTQSAVAWSIPVNGYVTTAGTAVTWVSGDTFATADFVAQPMRINGVNYAVASVTDATHLVLSTSAGVQVSVAWNFPVVATTGAFLDGYFIAAKPNTKIFYISAFGTGTSWDPLDNGVKEGYPDSISSILADHEELWLFGTDTTEVWRNTGNADFTFERDSGAFIHRGNIATWSPCRLGEGVAWLTGDTRGLPMAVIVKGYVPKRVSTHAEEQAWGAYSTVADAVSYSYLDQGHEFWVINFPTASATWAYDLATGLWHERGWWNGSANVRQRQLYHEYIFGKHIVGDWSTGVLYSMAMTLFDDNGTAIHRIRTAPHISKEDKWQFYHRFQLDMEVGTSTSSPSISLDWSDDGGHTFKTAVTATPSTALYSGRVIWRRLGSSRDRVFRVTITSGVKIALIAAYLDVEAGNS